MIRRLDDPRRVRALTRAARAASRQPGRFFRRAKQPTALRSAFNRALGHLLLTAILAALGMLVALQQVAVHLLTLTGVWLMDARIGELRQRLVLDANLAALAQLPIPNPTILTYQLRRRWQSAAWAGVYAAAFWSVAWSRGSDPAPWLWLPAVAIAHALVTEAMALLLAAHWPRLGLPLFIAIGAAVWAIPQSDQATWLWSAVEPMLYTVGWLTPWGWANGLAAGVPKDGRLGALLIALSAVAAWGVVSALERLRRKWRMDPIWYDVPGRPRNTWTLRDADGDDDEGTDREPMEKRSPEGAEQPANADAEVALPDETRTAQVQQALAAAKSIPSGQRMHELGWAGRQAFARWDEAERRLADRLEPAALGTPAWRWAMLLAGLPAATAIAGISPIWAPAALAIILLLLRRPWYALFALLIVLGCVFAWPNSARVICLFAPCAVALLLTDPFLGGTWGGLPMGSTLLGSIPRSWSSLMRVMLTFTGLRLLAGVPPAMLVAIALGHGFSVALGVGAGAGWIVLALFAPWIAALRLIQRTRDGVDLSLGRWWLTFAATLCAVAQVVAAAAVIAGACLAVVPSDVEGRGLSLVGGAIGASLVISALQIAMLRHAYRRRVDLLAPT